MNIDELKNLSSKVSDLKRVLSEKASKNSTNVSVNNVDIEGTLRVGILGDIVEILQLVTQESHGLMSKEDKKKLDGVAEGATNYVHPPTHPANIIVESTDKRFVSDVLIDKWNRKANEIVGNYVPETLGSDANLWLRCDNTWQPITASNVGALPITGGRLLGELGMNVGKEIKWYGDSDYGIIGFKNDSDVDDDSFMYFETSDNENEYFKFRHRRVGSEKEDWFTIKSDGVRAKGEIFALNDKKVFHTGNFDPNTKINQGGDTVNGDYKFKGYVKFGSASDNNFLASKSITDDIKNSAIEIIAPQSGSHNQKSGVVFHHSSTATSALKYISVNENKSYFDFVSDDSDPLEVKVAGSPVWTHKTFVKDDYYNKTSVDKLINDLISNMDWKESVERYEDLTTTYPHPEDGWTVNVKENNYTYRWDGGKWIVISINNLSLVTGSVDGLMSRHDKTKLDGIEAGANKYIHPTSHSADMITETPNKKFVSQEMINRWNSVSGDNTGLHVPSVLPSSQNKFLRCDNSWQSVTPEIVGTYSKGDLDSKLGNKENIGIVRPNVVSLSHSTEPGTETNYFVIKTNTNYGDAVMPHLIIRGKGLLEVGYTIPITIKIGFYYYNSGIYIPRAIVDSPTVITTSNKPIYICNIDGKYAIAIPGGYCAHISVDLINSSGVYSISPSGWSIFNKSKTEVNAIGVKTICPVTISYNSSNLDISTFLTKSGGKITGPIIREGSSAAWIDTKNGGGSPGLVQENYKGWNPFVRIKSHTGWFSIGTYYTPSPSDVNDFNIVGFKDSNNVNSPDTKFSLSLDGKGFINNKEIFTRGNFDPNSKANTSHGTHVPTPEGVNNAKFLRCDNTWQIVSPGNIGAVNINGDRLKGKLYSLDNQYAEAGNFGINMGNSSIVGINSLVFNDVCNDRVEGILFPKNDSSLAFDQYMNNYDSLRVKNGIAYLNDDTLVHSGNINTQPITPRYTYTFTVGGDANTYYPVSMVINTWPVRNIKLYRSYSETAPDTWYSPTHKGGLMVDMRICLLGWGGQQYHITGHMHQTYSYILGNIVCPGPATDTLVFLLRGGGAVYHIESDMPLPTPKVTLGRFDNTRISGETRYEGYVDPISTPAPNFNFKDFQYRFSSHKDMFFSGGFRDMGSGMATAGYMNASNTGNFTITGDMRANKVFNAVWNDYAELFPKKYMYSTEPGDIIALDINSNNEEYIKATEDLSSHVVGVHSDEYGHLLGGKEPPADSDLSIEEYNKDDFIPVGLAGRVKAKCVGIIKKGDKLVISDIPGVARAYIKGQDDPSDIFGMAVENKTTDDTVSRVRIFIK